MLLLALSPGQARASATTARVAASPVAAEAAPTAFKDFGDVPKAPSRRVVITGLGLVTPLGYDVESTWEAIVAGKTGVKGIVDEKFEGLPVKVAAYIEKGTGEGQFDGEALLGKKQAQQMAPFIQYAMVAAKEAMDDANWHPKTEEDAVRTGVSLGSGIGGIEDITEAQTIKTTRGPKKISPRFIPKMLINLAGGFVSMEHNAKGPNVAAVTACATGAHSIGDAFRFIKYNDADVMIAGGTESCVEPLSMAGFSQMRALSTDRNDDPARASRPFDESRSGFVMGEGAGILVLEELEHAKARGAKIYGEIRGVGYTGDAFHVSAPSGEGGRRAMEAALKQGGLEAKDVDYVNAHGTSTPVGDAMELETIQKLFSGACEPVVTSTKGATGHMLGAAGAVEAVLTTLAVSQDIIPPTVNLEKPVVTEGIKHVMGDALKTPVNAALSNSFGFGGTNACIAITKAPPS
jgi:3-oxoacyl-[acyl-carrier-protein] synthase II